MVLDEFSGTVFIWECCVVVVRYIAKAANIWSFFKISANTFFCVADVSVAGLLFWRYYIELLNKVNGIKKSIIAFAFILSQTL